MVLLIEFFKKKNDFEKKSTDNKKKHAKLPSMQRVNLPAQNTPFTSLLRINARKLLSNFTVSIASVSWNREIFFCLKACFCLI